jgi:hypothetical protein
LGSTLWFLGAGKVMVKNASSTIYSFLTLRKTIGFNRKSTNLNYRSLEWATAASFGMDQASLFMGVGMVSKFYQT